MAGRLLTEFLLLATASGYTLRHSYAPMRQSPAVTLMMAQPAVAPEITKPEAGIEVPTDQGGAVANGGFGIQPLTTVPELEEAMAAAHSAGRLCVVKFSAPWCTACKAIQPKFKRLARAYPEHDFYEVDFSRCKPLSKHCDITNLPTGIILEQGKLACYTKPLSPPPAHRATIKHTRGCAARSRLGSAHETRQGAPRTLTLTPNPNQASWSSTLRSAGPSSRPSRNGWRRLTKAARRRRLSWLRWAILIPSSSTERGPRRPAPSC